MGKYFLPVSVHSAMRICLVQNGHNHHLIKMCLVLAMIQQSANLAFNNNHSLSYLPNLLDEFWKWFFFLFSDNRQFVSYQSYLLSAKMRDTLFCTPQPITLKTRYKCVQSYSQTRFISDNILKTNVVLISCEDGGNDHDTV